MSWMSTDHRSNETLRVTFDLAICTNPLDVLQILRSLTTIIRLYYSCDNVEEILPLVETYVFVEHSSTPVITISGRPVITGTTAQFAEGISILADTTIHVDFHVAATEIADMNDSEEVENENGSDEMKTATLDSKLSKATLMRMF